MYVCVYVYVCIYYSRAIFVLHVNNAVAPQPRAIFPRPRTSWPPFLPLLVSLPVHGPAYFWLNIPGRLLKADGVIKRPRADKRENDHRRTPQRADRHYGRSENTFIIIAMCVCHFGKADSLWWKILKIKLMKSLRWCNVSYIFLVSFRCWI